MGLRGKERDTGGVNVGGGDMWWKGLDVVVGKCGGGADGGGSGAMGGGC
jgi:hypothetical protein